MQIKEAIEVILGYKRLDEHMNNNERLPACDMAIAALQKQIPKSHSCITDSDSVTCENCGSDVDKDYENFEYCPYCGQKL